MAAFALEAFVSLAVQPFGKLPFVCMVWQPLP
jgi:hypothetical protein